MLLLCFATLLLCFAMLLFCSCYVLCFLVISRYHDSFERCHLVGILPTDLPELSKPKASISKRKKTNILGMKDQRSENYYVLLIFAMFCYVVTTTRPRFWALDRTRREDQASFFWHQTGPGGASGPQENIAKRSKTQQKHSKAQQKHQKYNETMYVVLFFQSCSWLFYSILKDFLSFLMPKKLVQGMPKTLVWGELPRRISQIFCWLFVRFPYILWPGPGHGVRFAVYHDPPGYPSTALLQTLV